MPRDYKHVRRPKPSARKQAPGWVWLSAGLVIGLFIAFLVYLREHVPDERPSSLGTRTPQSGQVPAAHKTKPAQDVTSQARPVPPRPRFEFYTILPEREIRVPEHELAPRARRSPDNYVLQVGSFRKRDEAERLKASLALIGLEADIQSVSINEGDTWYRVRLGPYRDLPSLNEARARLREHRMEPMVLKNRG